MNVHISERGVLLGQRFSTSSSKRQSQGLAARRGLANVLRIILNDQCDNSCAMLMTVVERGHD